jgi:hypothetical protein
MTHREDFFLAKIEGVIAGYGRSPYAIPDGSDLFIDILYLIIGLSRFGQSMAMQWLRNMATGKRTE